MARPNDVTGPELVARARAMVPALRERAREAEEIRQLPQATIQDAADAGFFQVYVPKRYGGHEIDFRYGPQITRELARGCLSTAWVISFLNQHNWQLALFPDSAQQRVWAERPYMLAPTNIVPGGTATPVDGGYRVSGNWPWSSGVMHSNWFVATTVVPADGAVQDERYLLMPIEQTTIVDVWEVSGLAATGSNTVIVEDVFVTEEMQVSVAAMLDGTAPGFAVNANPLWRVPMVLLLDFNSLIAVSVGAAEGALEIFIEETKTKQISYGGGAAIDSSAMQMRVGRAQLQVTSVRNLFDATLAKIDDRTRAGEPLSEFERVEMVALGTHIIHNARWIVDEICAAAGSSINFLTHPLQRMRRDINVLASHGLVNFDRGIEAYGKVLLGRDIPTETVR